MSTTATTRLTDEDIDVHVAAIFDVPVVTTHHVHLIWSAAVRRSGPPLQPGGRPSKPGCAPLCAPGFDGDFPAWVRGAA